VRARAEGVFSLPELGFVADCVAAMADGPEPELTPCHRDYTARNWLLDDGRVSVIDFEHARIDARIWDFLRLRHQRWPGRPDLREAFLSGYGRELTEAEETLLRQCGAYNAVTTVLWALDVGDRGFEQTGRASLDLLRAP
jgi:Ser/Thr protein kinase RdoA (MazF antagonist)